jgi:oligopeptide transport system permease protein
MAVDLRAEHISTWRFLLRKLTEVAAVLLFATFFFFLLTHIVPGDPIRALFGFRPPPPELLAELRDQYGLDDPFFIQYAKYLRNLLQGEMGYSVVGAPVSGIIRTALPASVKLLAVAFVIQVVIGVGAAVIAVLRRRKLTSTLIQISTLLLLAIPAFALAYIVQGVFAQKLGWFPIRGLFGGWRGLALPAFTLAVISTAYVVRMAHVQLSDALDEPFIKTHRANGIPQRRLTSVHALRASLVPIITLIAASLSQLIGSLIIVETVFQIPGLGHRVFDAVRSKDHNVIVGILVVAVFFVILTNLAADLLSGAIDPRFRRR